MKEPVESGLRNHSSCASGREEVGQQLSGLMDGWKGAVALA